MTRDPPQHEPIDSACLFRRYAQFVASFLHRHGARGADLEDLVQEVFLQAHRRGGYRPGVASPTTFLAHLALEADLKRRRGEHRQRRDHNDDAGQALLGRSPADPADDLATKDSARRLQAALDAMEAGQRAVFILFELEGESCDAIAAGLELPVGTVYSRLHAARKTFCERIARDSAAAADSTSARELAGRNLKKKPEFVPTPRTHTLSRGGTP